MPSGIGEVVLIGGGGHAVVVAEAIRAGGGSITGVYDDDSRCAATRDPGRMPWLGTLDQAADLEAAWIVCLGELDVRARVIDRLGSTDPLACTVSHPASIVAVSATVGRGVFVGPLCVVHSRAKLGAHSIINSGAIIEHDCDIGENCHVAPRAVLGGTVRIGERTLVGIGAVVLPNLSIGRNCTIGAGAVVTRDVPDGARVVGVPGRSIN